MTNHKNYLSDEELECLMCEIESKDLVFAPPDIQEQVLNSQVDISELYEILLKYNVLISIDYQ